MAWEEGWVASLALAHSHALTRKRKQGHELLPASFGTCARAEPCPASSRARQRPCGVLPQGPGRALP